jgi:hypothetical protein
MNKRRHTNHRQSQKGLHRVIEQHRYVLYHVFVLFLTVSVLLPLIGGPMATAQPANNSTNGNDSATDFSIADVANESGTNYTDPSDVANESGTNYTNPRDVANKTGRNYTDPDSLRKQPGTLFAPKKENKKKKDKKWSEQTKVDLDCPGGWFNPKSYSCNAKQGIINSIYDGALDLMQATMDAVMGLIFLTPAPKANGQPAFLEKPTNWPWKTIYTDWYSTIRGIGVLIWVLLVLVVLVIRTYMPVGVMTDYQLRALWSRLFLILPLILFSFTLFSLYLNSMNGLIQAVRPSGELAASTMSSFFGQLGSVGIAIVITWYFEAIIFLFMFFLLWVRLFFIYVFAIMFPIMVPLAVVDVGPLSFVASHMRDWLGKMVTITLLPLPMAAAVTAGLLLVAALETVTASSVAIIQAVSVSPLTGLSASLGKEALDAIGAAIIMLSAWFVAAISPIILWRNSAPLHSMVGRFLGGANLDRDEIDEKVQEAKENVDHGGGRYRSDDILEDSPYQREADFESRFGGALESNWIARPSGPEPVGQLEGANLPIGNGAQPMDNVSESTQPTETGPERLTAGSDTSAIPGESGPEDDPTGGWRDTARRYAGTIFGGMFGGLFGGKFGRVSQHDQNQEAETDSESTTNRQPRSSTDNWSGIGPRRHPTAPISAKVEKAKERGTEVSEVTTGDELPDAGFNVGYIKEDGDFKERGSEEHKDISKQQLLSGYYEKVVNSMENRSSQDFLGVIKDPNTDKLYSLDKLIEQQKKEAFEQDVKRAHETFEDLDRQEREGWDNE